MKAAIVHLLNLIEQLFAPSPLTWVTRRMFI